VGDSLIIKRNSAPVSESVSVDMSSFDEKALFHGVIGLHRYGYDELKIQYKPETLRMIQSAVNNKMLGFAVVDQTTKQCTVRSLSNEIPGEFDGALRRAFFVTLSLGTASMEMIREQNFEGLSDLINLEETNNQLTNFCLRILTKKSKEKESFLKYVVVWNLEKVADEYKYLCQELAHSAEEIDPKLIETFEEVNELVKAFYGLFYKFDNTVFNETCNKKKLLENNLKDVKTRNIGEFTLVNHSLGLVQRVGDFATSLYALSHDRANA